LEERDASLTAERIRREEFYALGGADPRDETTRHPRGTDAAI